MWITEGNAAISRLAITYGIDLVSAGCKDVWHHLYGFGRIPISPVWTNRFPNEHLIEDALIGSYFGRQHLELDDLWEERAPSPSNDRWRIYFNRTRHCSITWRAQSKIYVNLHPDIVFQEFPSVIRILGDNHTPAFKIGRDIENMLRPDKFVVYLDSLDKTRELALVLASCLSNKPVQPLAFTAAVCPSGIISCGFDPPIQVAKLIGAQSWRVWVTRGVARFLQDGVREGLLPDELMSYCLRQLESLGIDTTKWVPKVIV